MWAFAAETLPILPISFQKSSLELLKRTNIGSNIWKKVSPERT